MHQEHQEDSKDSTNILKQKKRYPLPRMGVNINRCMIIKKSKRKDVQWMWLSPTLVRVLFGPAIPTSHFNFIFLWNTYHIPSSSIIYGKGHYVDICE
jgi:hypothetical protein